MRGRGLSVQDEIVRMAATATNKRIAYKTMEHSLPIGAFIPSLPVGRLRSAHVFAIGRVLQLHVDGYIGRRNTDSCLGYAAIAVGISRADDVITHDQLMQNVCGLIIATLTGVISSRLELCLGQMPVPLSARGLDQVDLVPMGLEVGDDNLCKVAVFIDPHI